MAPAKRVAAAAKGGRKSAAAAKAALAKIISEEIYQQRDNEAWRKYGWRLI